ncbi:appetite-regulating hormone [Tenrec ecaudatus]|uniref:appetite-regulating hormone n=1 Tax=Tenrec ecaudatus TaxID=94439 RepID=UPI003F5977B9
MLSRGTVCSLLLLTVLWVDLARAGSSFLSPGHPKVQRKESKKPAGKLQARAVEGWLRPEGGSLEDGAEDALEIQFNAPFDIGIKVSGTQYGEHGRALDKFLQDILWEGNKVSRASFPMTAGVSIVLQEQHLYSGLHWIAIPLREKLLP